MFLHSIFARLLICDSLLLYRYAVYTLQSNPLLLIMCEWIWEKVNCSVKLGNGLFDVWALITWHFYYSTRREKWKDEEVEERRRRGQTTPRYTSLLNALSQSVHVRQPVGWSNTDHLVAESCLSLVQIKCPLYSKMFGLNKWKKLSSNQKHTMFRYKGDWLPTYNDFTHWWCQ